MVDCFQIQRIRKKSFCDQSVHFHCLTFSVFVKVDDKIPPSIVSGCQNPRLPSISLNQASDPSPKHAEAYAPDWSVMFKEDYDGEPPSFYAAVEEYYPVYEIRRAARGEE